MTEYPFCDSYTRIPTPQAVVYRKLGSQSSDTHTCGESGVDQSPGTLSEALLALDCLVHTGCWTTQDTTSRRVVDRLGRYRLRIVSQACSQHMEHITINNNLTTGTTLLKTCQRYHNWARPMLCYFSILSLSPSL